MGGGWGAEVAAAPAAGFEISWSACGQRLRPSAPSNAPSCCSTYLLTLQPCAGVMRTLPLPTRRDVTRRKQVFVRPREVQEDDAGRVTLLYVS